MPFNAKLQVKFNRKVEILDWYSDEQMCCDSFPFTIGMSDCSNSVTTHPLQHLHNYLTQWKGTALCVATQYGHEDVIEILLEAKADPNLQIEVFCTPLILSTC